MKGYILLFLWIGWALPAVSGRPALAQASPAEITVVDRRGQAVQNLTDGDAIRLRLSLAESASQENRVEFGLDDLEPAVAGCTIPAGEVSCESEAFSALGWYWGPDRIPRPERQVRGEIDGALAAVSAPLRIASRPVVLVHGFVSNWQTWQSYLGPDGYLAAFGIRGFAVGDGQVEGTLNTGRLDQPKGRTHTIAENAAILGEYIQNVKNATGAQKVDLIGHSMGGMISRYYIDRLMQDDVAQLMMLGSPMAGSECANLPAALGFYLPAVLEIQPSYMVGVFNRQITRRHGVPFHALAGDRITDPIQSPCTPVPTDLAVSLASVNAIPLEVTELPVLHTEMSGSRQIFEEFVRPRLAAPPGSFRFEPDPPLAEPQAQGMQFTRLHSGNIPPGESRTLDIQIEPGVAVASFALFDPSRSLSVEVRGASGNVIHLDPAANGLIEVDDPAALFQLGYGFNNPRPGIWKVALHAAESAPPAGADFALAASFTGGAALAAQTSILLPEINQPVELTASLRLQDQALPVAQAQAVVWAANGAQQAIALEPAGEQLRGAWTPQASGLYWIEIQVTGSLPDGSPVERVTSLTVEVQPESPAFRPPVWLLCTGAGLVPVVLLGFVLLLAGAVYRRRAKTI